MEQLKKTLKDSARIRWSILILIAFVQAANYYFYDAISPLKRLLEDNFNISSGEYGMFVAAYSIPNTFLLMAVLGGIILDKLGIRRTGFLFVGLMAAGGLLTAYGASEYFSEGGIGYGLFNSFLTDYSPEFKVMLLGRFLFGLGAETSIVVVSKTIVKWFKGKELALAFGIKIGLARAGSALALFYSARIAEAASHWTIAIWFATMLLLLAFLAFLVYSVMDIKIDKQLKSTTNITAADPFSFSDFVKLLTNRSFIYVTLLCVTFYSAVFPFQAFSPDFLLNKFGMSLSKSGEIASILYWVTMIATPLFGFIVDKYGRSATLMIFGSILLTVIHLTFAFTFFNPVIPLVLLGIAIALVPAAMWPSVAKIVEEKRIGTAYGAMFSIQNLGLFLFPIMAGFILDTTNKNSESYISTGNMIYNTFDAQYFNNKNQVIKNSQLVSSVSIFTLDSATGSGIKDQPEINFQSDNYKALKDSIEKSGRLLWSEVFLTTSDDQGFFKCRLGSDSLDKINLAYFNLIPENILVKVLADNKDKELIFTTNNIATDSTIEHMNLIRNCSEREKSLLSEAERIIIAVEDTLNWQLILKEKHKVFFNKEGNLDLKLGKGDIIYANIDYLNMKDHYVAKVKRPLNYTYTLLMFAILGLFGFIFALLLRREDKKAGYGLELPSNSKTKK